MSFVQNTPEKPSERKNAASDEIHIRRQRERIAELERQGRPTWFAKAFLAILEGRPW
jgi:hypothetical protein